MFYLLLFTKITLCYSISFILLFEKVLGGYILFQDIQFSSVTQTCPTLCNPMNRRTPGVPVHHQLKEFTENHVDRVSDAIQRSEERRVGKEC